MEEMIQSEMSWNWNNMRTRPFVDLDSAVNGCPNWPTIVDSPGSVLSNSMAFQDSHIQTQFSYDQLIDWSTHEHIFTNSAASIETNLPTLFQEDYVESNEKYLLDEMEKPLQFSKETPFYCKSISEGVGDSCSTITRKKDGDQPTFKKPRIATSLPLPTFTVRKEKLGDRVTALQQIVSPFGKTDTASVLQEAVEYIKYLHDQVGTLSAPCLKNDHQLQHLQNLKKLEENGGAKQDLRSRGLCLVPISSTFAVSNDIAVDFWTPTFGLNFR